MTESATTPSLELIRNVRMEHYCSATCAAAFVVSMD